MSDVRQRNAGRKKGPKPPGGSGKHKKSGMDPQKFLKFAAVIPIAFVAYIIGMLCYTATLRSYVVSPVSKENIRDYDHSSLEKNREMFWGSYRPHAYFGMRTRSKSSLLFGTMWFEQHSTKPGLSIRHWCDQGDNLPKYGWTAHDGRNFGIQYIEDEDFFLTTDFVKSFGGSHGGDWTGRINVNPKSNSKKKIISLMLYFTLDGPGSLHLMKEKGKLPTIRGSTEELGQFSVLFNGDAQILKVHTHQTDGVPVDKLKEFVMSSLMLRNFDKEGLSKMIVIRKERELPDSGVSLVLVQLTVSLPASVEIVFQSGSYTDRQSVLQGQTYESVLNQHKTNFDRKFEKTFHLEQKGFNEKEIEFAKATLSNLIGGIGYWYGQSVVKSEHHSEPVPYWDAPLYSAVPSRSFFPRGFLWDEGFHNLIISQWDPELSKEIIAHWLDLMNADGWIPREQILGAESRARVPAEFVVQHNSNANPPTLFLPLQHLLRYHISDRAADQQYVRRLLPRLRRWYSWYNDTQGGPLPATYQWKGRDSKSNRELNPKTLTSGLDDYPRASHPDYSEYHLDLRCWMTLASRILTDISKSLGEPYQEYEATYEMLRDNKLLNKLHWSEAKKRYSDYGLHTDYVALRRPQIKLQPGQQPPVHVDKVRVVTRGEPEHRLVDSHFGYMSLFPLLLQVLDADSPQLTQLLADLQKENLLWTNFGLRSLAVTSPMYNKRNTEHDPPYWRGAIWINMNLLCVSALKHYSGVDGPNRERAGDLYVRLKTNIQRNIFNEYQRTGYVWEQYDDKTGRGKGSHPFTGWSAGVVLLMADKF